MTGEKFNKSEWYFRLPLATNNRDRDSGKGISLAGITVLRSRMRAKLLQQFYSKSDGRFATEAMAALVQMCCHSVTSMRVPCHVGVQDIERADTLAVLLYQKPTTGPE